MSEQIKLIVTPIDSSSEHAGTQAAKRSNAVVVFADSAGSSEDLVWYRVAEKDRRKSISIHGLSGNAAPAYLSSGERDRLRDAGVSVQENSVRNAGGSDLVLYRDVT